MLAMASWPAAASAQIPTKSAPHDGYWNCFVPFVDGDFREASRLFREAAKEEGKEQVYQQRREGNEKLDKAAQVLRLFTDPNIAEQTPFREVRVQAFRILDGPEIDFVADHITTDVKCDETAFQWEHIDELAPHFKRHLRPILLAVDWAASAGHSVRRRDTL